VPAIAAETSAVIAHKVKVSFFIVVAPVFWLSPVCRQTKNAPVASPNALLRSFKRGDCDIEKGEFQRDFRKNLPFAAEAPEPG
jgi:hypothetical protein